MTASDWTSVDLQPGQRCLVQASAGTGKSWTISALYLRLLLERQLAPTQIVVTTFTDAAAADLIGKLRQRLVQALHSVQGGATSADHAEIAAWLQTRWQTTPALQPSDALRLRLALAELDQAPIGTLHALCLRILADFPFESRGSFEPPALTASEALRDELADDLWRVMQQGDPATLPPLPSPLTRKIVRERLRVLLAAGVVVEEDSLAALLQARPDPALLARMQTTIDAGAFKRVDSVMRKAWLATIDAQRSDAADIISLPDPARLLLEDELAKQFKPAALDDPALLRLLDDVRAWQTIAARQQAAADLAPWLPWLATARHWRDARLQARGQLGFDDLIAHVYAALQDDDGTLAARLHAAWPALLVDEFQDTDGLQYAILDRICRDPAGDPRGLLLMVGDPKQAIYGFRGGDIHAYLAAAKAANAELSLRVNRRSTPALVTAMNALFAAAGPTLSRDAEHAIRYEAVAAHPTPEEGGYSVDGVAPAAPLVLHLRTDVPASSSQRVEAALQACANQISGLLHDGRHRLAGAPLQPGQLAVLLPANAHIVRLRDLLQQRGVPCVTRERRSVFATATARDLQLVLHAVVARHDPAALRAALATRLHGLDIAAAQALLLDDAALQRHADVYALLAQRWQTHGVLGVVDAVAAWAASGDERQRTDLRHLGELLQAKAADGLAPAALLDWFAHAREAEAADDEAARERLLRLESEGNRVQLMTLHASKGLEFDIVLLPLMWANVGRNPGDLALMHDDASGLRRIALGSDEATRVAEDGQAERFRLLYVALTRARHACHVYVLPPTRPQNKRSKLPFSDPHRSALDALLDRLDPGSAWDGHRPAALPASVGWQHDEWAFARVDASMAATGSSALTQRLPLPPPPAYEARWSFSTLTRHRSDALDDAPAADERIEPAEDERIDNAAPPHPELLRLHPIAGPEIGNALHAVFEQRDPNLPLRDQRGLVQQALAQAGVRLRGLDESTVIDALIARVHATLETPLPLTAGPVRLIDVPPTAMRAEMGFDFAIDTLDLQHLRHICATHGQPGLVPTAAPATLRGLMTGKIDLIFHVNNRFHILDYKGNRLGDGALSAYAPAALTAAMDAHHYRFQAFLYAIALRRLLRQRLGEGFDPQQHMGEAIYLFVRAVGLAPEAGIWREHFEPALLAAADAVFAGREA